MQDNEMLILEELEKDSNITQRDLSEKTGLSLGMVNILLKRFIRKGFVKLERLNSKSFRYILTPEGFKEKTKKTIEYMKIYYRRTLLIKQNIERIVQTYGRNRTYVLFGKDKEMKEIIEGILKELRVKYITANYVEKIESTNVVLYWNIEDKEKLEGLKYEFLMHI